MTDQDIRTKAEELVSACARACKSGKRIAVTGHDLPDADSIISAVMMKKFLEKFNIMSSVRFCTRPDNVTARDMGLLGILGGIELGEFEDNDLLLLVDHHKSFYDKCVIASVDHHTTLPEPEGEVTLVVSASSCGRVIFDMAEALGIADEELERLAIYSVYLDTQSCRSPKFKKRDTEWLEKGIKKYGIDRNSLERMGFCLNDSSEDTETLAMYGYKKYSFCTRPSFSTCIQIDRSDEKWGERIADIVEYLKKRLCAEGGAVWAFVVNMPIETRSDIYFIDFEGRVECQNLDRLASRSRDVIPIVSIAQ